jgi:hypothetical protein
VDHSPEADTSSSLREPASRDERSTDQDVEVWAAAFLKFNDRDVLDVAEEAGEAEVERLPPSGQEVE